MILYTWDDPQGVRKLLWKPYKGIDKPIEAHVDKVKSLAKLSLSLNVACICPSLNK